MAIKELFKEVTETVKNVTTKAVNKIDNTVDVQKLKYRISKKEEEINNVYKMLGEEIVKAVYAEESFDEKIAEAIAKIEELKEELDAINTERLVQIVLDGEQEEFLIYASDYANELHDVEETMHKIAKNSVDSMKMLFGAQHEFANRGEYAREVVKCPVYMKDFLFRCFDNRIFWDYAKSWSVDRWVKAINDFKVGENNG